MSIVGAISYAQSLIPAVTPTSTAAVSPPAPVADTSTADDNTVPSNNSIYSAVDNVNASTVRGANLNITA